MDVVAAVAAAHNDDMMTPVVQDGSRKLGELPRKPRLKQLLTLLQHHAEVICV